MHIEYLNTSMTDLIVQKFGGTSVANLDRIEKVAEIIQSSAKNNDVVVVISAMAGETDRLFNLGQKYFNHDNVREMDALLLSLIHI